MRAYHFLCASAAIFLLFSCEKKEEEKPKPEPVTPKIEIPAESQAIFSHGISIESGTSAQSQTVMFTSTAAWSADVTDTKASTWLSVQPTSGGAGSIVMTVTAQPNTGKEGREASVTIKCSTVTQKFTVKQAGVPNVDVTEVTLDKAELSLVEGQEADLKATVKPDNASDKTVTWTSSDEAIATVADGKVKAVRAGTATITAKAGAKEATCKVTVTAAAVPVESIKLDKESLEMVEGAKATLTATVTPDNATDKTVTWMSSDEAIATVANGEVTAVKEGTATITAKAGDKSATCAITVSKNIITVTSVTLDKTSLELVEGDETSLTATVKPDDATDKTVTWTTSDAAIAKVTDGKVTAVKEGTATITAKAGDKEATCAVKVAKKVINVESITLSKTTLSLKKGESETLTATVTPDNATDKTVTWSTSNAEVATVENGKVTAVKSGTATITAKAGEESASCAVTVTTPVQSVTLDQTSVTLEEGKTLKITATINPADADDKDITWSTSNAAVASVENGVITAVAEGTATIAASAGGKSASCKVTVQKKVIPVSSVTLNKTTLSIAKDQSEALTATVAPDNATDKTVTWSTSDAKVATVDQSGKVTAIDGGTATIKAACGEKSAECAVTVTVPVESITLDKATLELKKGESANLVATVGPANADDKTVTWTSSAPEVATVENGKVTAVKSGSAIITASAGNKSVTCTVSVTTPVTGVTLDQASITLEEGQSTTLVATVSPEDADNKTVTWTTSNAAVTKVANGVVTAVAEGEATITATAGSESASCKVTVTYLFSITPNQVSASENGQEFTVTVVCSGTYQVGTLPTWIKQLSVNNKVHKFSVEKNPDHEERSAAVVFTDGKGFQLSCTITQKGQPQSADGGNEDLGDGGDINW